MRAHLGEQADNGTAYPMPKLQNTLLRQTPQKTTARHSPLDNLCIISTSVLFSPSRGVVRPNLAETDRNYFLKKPEKGIDISII